MGRGPVHLAESGLEDELRSCRGVDGVVIERLSLQPGWFAEIAAASSEIATTGARVHSNPTAMPPRPSLNGIL